MINTKFEAYKVARELKRSGKDYGFFRYGKNAFNEPTGTQTSVCSLKCIYHEQNSNIEIVTGDTTQVRTKKIPMLLCLYDASKFSDLKIGDFVTINSKKYKLTGIVNIQEWNIITDISLEVEDDGVHA